jgi:sugar phosphate permease
MKTSANIAGALGPFISTYIALKYHWSIGFTIYGCICMTVGYLSIIVLRNKPGDVSLQNIDTVKTKKQKNDKEDEPIKKLDQIKMMLRYPFFACICSALFLVQLIKTIYLEIAQIYLTKVVKIDPYTSIFVFYSFSV